MSFSPVCRWVGWRHYIQYRPSRHHRSQPHTSPLASGTLARTRWCTGFIQGGETKQGTKQLDEVENTEKSRASEHKYVWVDKRMHQQAKKPAKLVALMTKFLIRRCKTRLFFLRQTSNAPGRFASSTSHFFPSFLPSGGTKPGTPFCLAASDETRSNSVWRQLQLPFGCASLNHFKYTLTCAHPLTGRQGTEEGGGGPRK